MPDIKAALYAYLSGQSSITNIVGTNIYANWATYDTPEPYIIISRIDGADFAPQLSQASDRIQSTVQLDIWGIASVQAETLAELLRGLLDGYTGAMGSEHIYAMRQTSIFDGPLAPNDGANVATARSTMTFEVWHT